MTLSRFAIAALCACGVAATMPVAAPADTSSSRAVLELSSAGKRALKTRSISVSTKQTFRVADWSVGNSAKIALTGKLRFRSGKRRVDATRLRLTIGRTSSYVTARISRRSVRLFSVRPTRPAVLDSAAQRASITGARVALTRTAARRLKSSLKLRRTPSTAAFGKLTAAVAKPATQVPMPQPAAPVPQPAPPPAIAMPAPAPTRTPTATPTPTPTATPIATATPGPALACAERIAATPVNIVDWFSCDMPEENSLKSWTSYIQRPLPGPCPGGAGTAVAGFGAAQVVAGDVYDHRFPVLSHAIREDGSATIIVGGHVTYTMPVHGIDETIGSFRIELDADGLTGSVFADGRSKVFDMGADVCTTPATPYSGEKVLTLDLTGITPQDSGGVRRWVKIPAKIAPGTKRLGGGIYAAGSAWGSFTIAVPAT